MSIVGHRWHPKEVPVVHTLIVVRHAKSDRDVPMEDRERPLAPRGRRQAPATGRWLAANLDPPDLAVVSPATRAQQTWELVRAELPEPPATQVADAAYTFDGDALLAVVAGLPADARTAVLVGHSPAVDELVESITGRPVRMTTSALAVVELPAWDAGTGRLRAVGRPADGAVTLDQPPRG